MAQAAYEQVIRLVEQLSPQEQEALVAYLQERAKHRHLTTSERKALFESMTVDLGPVSPDISLRRADWYGDDER
jgi:hypothetical protein